MSLAYKIMIPRSRARHTMRLANISTYQNDYHGSQGTGGGGYRARYTFVIICSK